MISDHCVSVRCRRRTGNSRSESDNGLPHCDRTFADDMTEEEGEPTLHIDCLLSRKPRRVPRSCPEPKPIRARSSDPNVHSESWPNREAPPTSRSSHGLSYPSDLRDMGANHDSDLREVPIHIRSQASASSCHVEQEARRNRKRH